MLGEMGDQEGACFGATHPRHGPQQGLGPLREAHGIEGSSRTARAEGGSLHGRTGAFCPFVPPVYPARDRPGLLLRLLMLRMLPLPPPPGSARRLRRGRAGRGRASAPDRVHAPGT